MLDPNGRSQYTSLLTPPPGYSLDQALGTTFSLDIPTLLTIPVHLSLLGAERRDDGIAVYESVRRTMDRVTLYLQRGQMRAPTAGNHLFGLLEPCMVEVEPPGDGVFHPKVWVLRFRPDEGVREPPLLRVAILSRNVTDDRSWDLSLQLDGELGEEMIEANRPLAQLLEGLPGLAAREVDAGRRAQARELARDLMACKFALPHGAETIEFAVPGLPGMRWEPEKSDRLAVISPFLKDAALGRLAGASRAPVALVSRPEELEQVSADVCGAFGGCYVLHEAAETEDNEGEIDHDTHGLHAKAWISERGARTSITLGSANVTDAALLAQHNLEVIATLKGPRRKLGGIDDLLGEKGLGGVLQRWEPGERAAPADAELVRARERLERARTELARGGLRVVCEAGSSEDMWRWWLVGQVELPESVNCRVWPVSRSPNDAAALGAGGAAGRSELPYGGVAYLTGVIAFELTDPAADHALRFALNLPIEGLPAEEREAAILRAVVDNRDGFLRYLMLLLANDDAAAGAFIPMAGSGHGHWQRVVLDELPLLEEMTRCYSREPERLRDIAEMIERLQGRLGTSDLVPPEFEALWRTYQEAMEHRDGRD
ncbi:phospholipase D family protein [Thioalkalivibrio sp. ALJ9]|uniref:phospholipase D family protein n=1 Tax=Thioalkalivibrio sp. ALJ9 TaxID=1158758 RepID=UPI00037206BA|nr:phospholipase D family protein [Thioalkalivibrio sp. ALJ9]